MNDDNSIQLRVSKSQVAWVSSLLLHALLLLAILFYQPDMSQEEAASRSVQTRTLSVEEYQQLMRRQAQEGRPIVESSPAVDSSVDSKNPAKYLGERTQRVAKETRAGQFGSVSGGKPGATGGEAGEKESNSQTHKSLKDLGLSSGVDTRLFENQKSAQAAGQNGQNANLNRGSMDSLGDDVAVGAETLLNTDEFVYSSFFNRLKSEVAPRWEPIIRQKVAALGGHLRSGYYTTGTRFVLDENGRVIAVQIEEGSGVGEFDEAAREALERLGRIDNPPIALRESDGRYRLRLGFVIDLRQSMVQMNYVPDPRLQR